MFYTSSPFGLPIYLWNSKTTSHSFLTFCGYNKTLERKLMKRTVLSCLTILGILVHNELVFFLYVHGEAEYHERGM